MTGVQSRRLGECVSARIRSARSNPRLTAPRCKSIVASLICGMPLLFAAYVLSYAPVVRYGGHEEVTSTLLRQSFIAVVPADGSRFPLYKPVDWLIDNTPLREPLTSDGGKQQVSRIVDPGRSTAR